MRKKIVRGIDVGYGNTKICHGGDVPSALKCEHFPSIASLHAGVDKGAGVMAKRELVEVESGGNVYLVGKDALDTLSARDDQGRTLLTDFIFTPQHLALYRGGLRYLQEQNIDLLVSGLPVNYFSQHKEHMEQRLKGIHQYPDGIEINVKEVWIVPQPIGGFIHYFFDNDDIEDLSDLKSLTIDVGYFTLDWLVCRGLKLLDERSGSCPGGMSLILEKLTQFIGEERGVPFSDYHMVDKGVRNGYKTRIQGKPYDFSHFIPRIEGYITNSIQSMLRSVGTLDDIDVIVLVGGGGHCYQSVLQKLLNDREIIMPDHGVYSNVKGFYLAGAERVKQSEN